MKKSSKGLVITLLFAVLLNAVVFTPSVSAAENRATVWVKVHRIQLIDDIENDLEEETDWRCTITVIDGETVTTQGYKLKESRDDVTFDREDSFTGIKNQDVFVTITLYEDDQSCSETADISSSGISFDCTYNLASNELGGDKTVIEGDYYDRFSYRTATIRNSGCSSLRDNSCSGNRNRSCRIFGYCLVESPPTKLPRNV